MSTTHRAAPVVGIAGLGYMGLATGLGFAHAGVRVVGYEVRADVRLALARGRTTIHEPGLPALLRQEVESGRFRLVPTWDELVEQSEVVFLCLPTPRRADGRIDLRPMEQGVRELGQALKKSRRAHLVVVKSTVVPGTTEGLVRPLLERVARTGAPRLTVAANPEFLAEGSMVRDVLRPERVVVGVTSTQDERRLRAIYRGIPSPVIVLSPTGAELVKYASNAFLALKVSFVNEVARFAEAVGSDVDAVAAAVGRDSRIGSKFLSAGPGFGGSCFEKDVRALVARGHDLGLRPRLLESLVPSNEDQTRHAFAVIGRAVGPLRGRRVAVLGLAFKAGTDDVRESRALPLVTAALRAGAEVRLHDPVALENFRRAIQSPSGRVPRRLRFCERPSEAVRGADVAVVQAAWPEYRRFPPAWTRSMRSPTVVDLRRALPEAVRRRPDLRWIGLGTASAGENRPSTRGRRRRRGRP